RNNREHPDQQPPSLVWQLHCLRPEIAPESGEDSREKHRDLISTRTRPVTATVPQQNHQHELCLQTPQEEPQLPDAGTYYCAVLMCGEMIFGSGTKLDFVGVTSKTDILCLNGWKYIQDGENIHLNCFFVSVDPSAIAWFKQTPGEKPLLIASAFHSLQVKFHNDFGNSGRFTAVRAKSSFNLTISNAVPSDSATYYCTMADYTDVALSACTVLVLKGSSSDLSAVLQHPVSDPVELGGDTTLQCSVFTDTSAGEHSVYWFRHGSGESHPGIIYTHGNRSDQCKSSSETDSSTQSCVYKLPKRNLSLSDAGTYYCAVLMCGEIIFGSGTKLDFVGSTLKTDIQCLNGLKYADDGGTINLNCFLSSTDVSATAWFKQTPGEKPLLIASTFHTAKIRYHDEFERSGRFHAVTDKSSFNLTISNAEPSDSATYYCAMADYTNIALSACTVLVLKDSSSRLYTVLQHPVSDPVELGGDTTLQCSVLTDTSAGEHSVYWFRHGSGESHPGIIYTHGNRSDQCKSSSETDSSTQSCVYKLPKRNLSLSDAGTYYCAVAACGQVLFGNGTKLDFVEKGVLYPTLLVLAASNIISLIVIVFLWRKLHSSRHKGGSYTGLQ
ncbi:hypothetical protein NFI96_008426, partial [Prochilodus magdalenae]